MRPDEMRSLLFIDGLAGASMSRVISSIVWLIFIAA